MCLSLSPLCFVTRTDLSGVLVVLVEEVVSPVLDAGLNVLASPGHTPCSAPEGAGGGEGEGGAPTQPRHGQAHLATKHQTPGNRSVKTIVML